MQKVPDETRHPECKWPECNCYSPQVPQSCRLEHPISKRSTPLKDGPVVTLSTPQGYDGWIGEYFDKPR